MKLRIIRQGQLFVPQYHKKNYYSSSWTGFGAPVVKFLEQEDAQNFVKLLNKSVTCSLKNTNTVVWQNYENKPKLPARPRKKK